MIFVFFYRDRFPFYKSNDDRWKNSVRHNLSINPHFRKGSKAPQGAGHLWTISSRESENNILAWEHVRFFFFFNYLKIILIYNFWLNRKNKDWNYFLKWKPTQCKIEKLK